MRRRGGGGDGVGGSPDMPVMCVHADACCHLNI